MQPRLEYRGISDPAELTALESLISRTFGFPDRMWPVFVERIGQENLRIVRRDGSIPAGLGVHRLGQWFGGRSMKMGGVAIVGVAPEHRGGGLAFTMMSLLLQELRENGVPLSTLFASTSRLYRKVGYEHAGNRVRYEIPTGQIEILGSDLPMRSVDPAPSPEIRALCNERAVRSNGNLDRNPGMWERLFRPVIVPDAYVYLVGPESAPEGFVAYTRHRDPGEPALRIRDWYARRPAAGRRIWSFFAAHRSLGPVLSWIGPAVDPMVTLLPEQSFTVKQLERWLLRIVDVPKALAERGYPEDADAEIHLEVKDEILGENEGSWILRVGGGRGEAKRGGRGSLRVHVRGLAALYSGLHTPEELRSIGLLDGEEAELRDAGRIFTGPEPWMPEIF